MESRNVITDFKNALRFVKPLAKIVEHLEYVEGLGQREKVLKQTIYSLESNKQDLSSQIASARDTLVEKQQSVKAEIQKINEGVRKEKEDIIREYDEKINILKISLRVSEQQRDDLLQEVKGLKLAKNNFTKEVTRLRDVLNITNEAVSSVEGGD